MEEMIKLPPQKILGPFPLLPLNAMLIFVVVVCGLLDLFIPPALNISAIYSIWGCLKLNGEVHCGGVFSTITHKFGYGKHGSGIQGIPATL